MKSVISTFNFQLLVGCAVCSAALAAEPPKPAPRSMDDALRDSLDSRAGDDYDRALLGDADKPDAKSGAKDMEKKLKKELGAAAEKEGEKNPLLRAAEGMREVQERLAQRNADAVTQKVQQQVVADLQKLIDETKKNSRQMGGMQSSNQRTPAGNTQANSKPRPTPSPSLPGTHPATESDPNAKPPRDDGKKLAEKIKKYREQYLIGLPEHEREQMLELPGEYFLPEYEREIEDYFRRMSSGTTEEQR